MNIFLRLGKKAARALTVTQHDGVRVALSKIFLQLLGVFGYKSGQLRAYLDYKKSVDDQFDNEMNCDTGGVQHLHALSIDSANARHGTSYIASDPDEFRIAISNLDVSVEGATFVDLGSGKGRAVMLAAAYPFKKIVGVEFAAELHESARDNIAKIRDPRVELVHKDVAEFVLPDEPLILFLYNPFDATIVRKVAHNALLSWLAYRRPIRVVYINPVAADVFIEAGWRLVGDIPACYIFAPPQG